ncbi:MAG: cobalamin B12-binding domain-containing protein, partial [Candidatus Methanoperedens sp.]
MKLDTDINKVLLISPPWYRLFGGEGVHSPLGLCYIGGVLEQNGYDVKIYNADFNTGREFLSDDNITEKYHLYLNNLKDINHKIWNEIEIVLHEQSPDIVGISVTTAKYGSALNVSRLVKKLNPDIPVIWGGVHPTILPEETIKNKDVDIVVR